MPFAISSAATGLTPYTSKACEKQLDFQTVASIKEAFLIYDTYVCIVVKVAHVQRVTTRKDVSTAPAPPFLSLIRNKHITGEIRAELHRSRDKLQEAPLTPTPHLRRSQTGCCSTPPQRPPRRPHRRDDRTGTATHCQRYRRVVQYVEKRCAVSKEKNERPPRRGKQGMDGGTGTDWDLDPGVRCG